MSAEEGNKILNCMHNAHERFGVKSSRCRATETTAYRSRNGALLKLNEWMSVGSFRLRTGTRHKQTGSLTNLSADTSQRKKSQECNVMKNKSVEGKIKK